MSTKESDVETVCSGVRYSNAHRTGKGILLTAVGSGEVHILSEGSTEPELVARTNGQPAGVAMDSTGRIYIADAAMRAVTQVTEDGNKEFVKEYEGKTFCGPNSLAFGPDGSMYFTDSGPLGETTLQNSSGSCFCITMLPKGDEGEQILKPLVHECLAHPSGIAVSPGGKNIYVSEMLCNRVLRLFEYPAGVWQTSVYYQFSGKVGPSGLACGSDGTLYVGRFEPSKCALPGAVGIVSVISPNGTIVRDIVVPGPSVEGVALSDDETCLYVSEASTKCVYKVAL